MGCVARATRALEGAAGVEQVTFVRESERFPLNVTSQFQLKSAASHLKQAGKLHDRQNGIRHGSPWTLRIVETTRKEPER